MDVWHILERARLLHPHQAAVIEGSWTVDYATLHARTRSLGLFLRERGLQRGDRLAILAWNGHEFLECSFAAAGIGAILCPLNVRLAPRELAQVLSDARAHCLVADPEFHPVVLELLERGTSIETVLWTRPREGAAPGCGEADYAEAVSRSAPSFEPVPNHPDEVAHLYYTSGTTGEAKGVMLTHRNVCVHALGTIAEFGLTDDDRWAHIAPMFHLADAWAILALTWVGGTHVVLPRFEPEAALDLLERERITITNLVPTMLNRMVRHPRAAGRDWSALRMLLTGGAPIAPQIVREVLDVFRCPYVQTYGMTETSPFLTLNLPSRRRVDPSPVDQVRLLSKTGRPFVAVELRIVDERGAVVPMDEQTVGEIRARGATVTPGYWNRAEETRAAFEDGWLKTGDLAVWDREGYVTIVDRRKDMILSGGENVYSTEVENVLHEHPAVLEAAVFGRADPVWGESVCAAIVPRPGMEATPTEITAFARLRLAGFKLPRQVFFLDSLPRTGTHKVSKRQLRERFEATPGAEPRPSEKEES